jgi:glutamate racemase
MVCATDEPTGNRGVFGVFDSGVGGLSVVRHLLLQYPEQSILYVADQAHAPYGERPLSEIRRLAAGITRFLLSQGAHLIVLACNTASAAALHELRGAFPEVPFVGMEPALKPAAERTLLRRVGIVATAATFQGELFASLLDRYGTGIEVRTQVCPDWVRLVEAGDVSSPRARESVARCLEPLLSAGIDELVLGCTHYPFLRPLIEQVVGLGVEVIDPAPAVARQAGRVLSRQQTPADEASPPTRTFFTTGDRLPFQDALCALLGQTIPAQQAYWQASGNLVALTFG